MIDKDKMSAFHAKAPRQRIQDLEIEVLTLRLIVEAHLGADYLVNGTAADMEELR